MLVLEQVFPAATQPGKLCANNYAIAVPSHILYIVSQYEKHMVFKGVRRQLFSARASRHLLARSEICA
jgi:hypothetical protein